MYSIVSRLGAVIGIACLVIGMAACGTVTPRNDAKDSFAAARSTDVAQSDIAIKSMYEKITVEVVKWNGKKGAFSFTFDDGMDSHLDIVCPILNENHMTATFFLNGGGPWKNRVNDWKKALSCGHEIGNHGLDHKNVGALSGKELDDEISLSRKKIEGLVGAKVISFAWAFCGLTDKAKNIVRQHHLIARTCEPAINYSWLDSRLNWMDVKTVGVAPSHGENFDNKYGKTIEEAYRQEAWLSYFMHSVGDGQGYEPLPLEDFKRMVSLLKGLDVWVAPFGTVACYFKAGLELKSRKPVWVKNEYVLNWTVAQPFGDQLIVKLKVVKPERFDGELTLEQDNTAVQMDEQSYYPVDFLKGRVVFKLIPVVSPQ